MENHVCEDLGKRGRNPITARRKNNTSLLSVRDRWWILFHYSFLPFSYLLILLASFVPGGERANDPPPSLLPSPSIRNHGVEFYLGPSLSGYLPRDTRDGHHCLCAAGISEANPGWARSRCGNLQISLQAGKKSRLAIFLNFYNFILPSHAIIDM